jgi:hypothetical protein
MAQRGREGLPRARSLEFESQECVLADFHFLKNIFYRWAKGQSTVSKN